MKKINADDQFQDWTDKWEKAQQDGIFTDAPKPAQPRPQHTPDFFGQYPSLDSNKGLNAVDAEYWRQVYRMSNGSGDAPDITDADNQDFEDGGDHPLRDHRVRKQGKLYKEFFGGDDKGKSQSQTRSTGGKIKRPSTFEEYMPPTTDIGDQKATDKKKVDMVANDPNPQYSTSYGPDTIDNNTGTTRVSPGLAAADKNILKLDDLKRSLYELECKMSDAEGLSESKIKNLDSKLKNLKQQIEEISDAIPPKYPGDHL